jgi:hypothetical protein
VCSLFSVSVVSQTSVKMSVEKPLWLQVIDYDENNDEELKIKKKQAEIKKWPHFHNADGSRKTHLECYNYQMYSFDPTCPFGMPEWFQKKKTETEVSVSNSKINWEWSEKQKPPNFEWRPSNWRSIDFYENPMWELNPRDQRKLDQKRWRKEADEREKRDHKSQIEFIVSILKRNDIINFEYNYISYADVLKS